MVITSAAMPGPACTGVWRAPRSQPDPLDRSRNARMVKPAKNGKAWPKPTKSWLSGRRFPSTASASAWQPCAATARVFASNSKRRAAPGYREMFAGIAIPGFALFPTTRNPPLRCLTPDSGFRQPERPHRPPSQTQARPGISGSLYRRRSIALGRSRTASAHAEDNPRKLGEIAADIDRERRASPTTWESSPKLQRRRNSLRSVPIPP